MVPRLGYWSFTYRGVCGLRFHEGICTSEQCRVLLQGLDLQSRGTLVRVQHLSIQMERARCTCPECALWMTIYCPLLLMVYDSSR